METYLSPIEKPAGFGMKVAFFFTRRQFGKVLMPLKVHSARLPSAFGMFYSKLPQLDKKLKLPKESALLIREHVARINECQFCMDANRYAAMKDSINMAKFLDLDQYHESSAFTDKERAALDYVTALTKEKHVDPATFKKLAGYYTETEICEIVWLVASEHLYNLTNIGLNIHSDKLCEIKFNK